MSVPEESVRSFAQLCAALEVSDLEGFEEWLESQHDEPEWANCETTVESDHLSVSIFHIGLDRVDFDLSFPSTLDDVWSQVHRMNDTVTRHQNALYLSVDRFGDPECDDDGTDEVATLLFVSPEDLIEAIGGPWIPFEGPQWDYNGGLIYHWFASGEPASVLLGFGGDDVYIEPVSFAEDGSPQVAEWPEPTTANRVSAEAEGFPLSEAEFLERLRVGVTEARQQAGGMKHAATPKRKRRGMGDHDVRMTTRNMRVAGIDLDFDVKVDGRVLGTLSVSEGGLLWRPANYQKKRGIPISWTEFADWAQS